MNDKDKRLRVCWFSAGVSSFIAAYLSKPDKIIYIDIDDQHPDSMRFVKDCEKLLKQPIEILKSQYGSVENACLSANCIKFVKGYAACTDYLKKRVRKEWELQQTPSLTYIWGMDYAERNRADRLTQTMPKQEHEFPLIERQLSKQDAHELSERLGIKRPKMYDLGYSNNNCVGCVKGGMGYWNKIRVDFPEVFKQRSELEQKIGASCLKECFLHELDPNRGRMAEEILPECDIFCYVLEKEDL